MLQIVLDRLLALLFPPRCASCRTFIPVTSHTPLCSECASEISVLSGPKCSHCGRPFETPSGPDHVCSSCIERQMPYQKACSIFVFEKSVRRLIHRYKYSGDLYALNCLVEITRSNLHVCFQEACSIFNGLILPVPVHKGRLRKRGFNQSLGLASEIFPSCNVKSGVLVKTRATPSQTGLTKKQRKKNVKGAFFCRDLSSHEKDVLIFDDVLTTGATVHAAAEAVKKAGARRIFVLTVARAGPDSAI